MAKILLFDLEVSRDVVEGYGNKWDFKVVKVVKPQEMMCYAYKWLGESKIHYVSRHHFKKYKDFVISLRDLLNDADVVIAHNGNGFDIKMANRFFIKDDIAPPSPYKSIDTLRVARGVFKFMSNSLGDLAEYLEVGSKVEVGYKELETDFLNNPTHKIERLMSKYNKEDVALLEKIYIKMRPFMRNHPNLGDIEQIDGVCPVCLSKDLNSEGTHARRNGRVQSYSCNNCGHWCNSNSIIKPKGRMVNG